MSILAHKHRGVRGPGCLLGPTECPGWFIPRVTSWPARFTVVGICILLGLFRRGWLARRVATIARLCAGPRESFMPSTLLSPRLTCLLLPPTFSLTSFATEQTDQLSLYVPRVSPDFVIRFGRCKENRISCCESTYSPTELRDNFGKTGNA